jgi:hypothetical protein
MSALMHSGQMKQLEEEIGSLGSFRARPSALS